MLDPLTRAALTLSLEGEGIRENMAGAGAVPASTRVIHKGQVM